MTKLAISWAKRPNHEGGPFQVLRGGAWRGGGNHGDSLAVINATRAARA